MSAAVPASGEKLLQRTFAELGIDLSRTRGDDGKPGNFQLAWSERFSASAAEAVVAGVVERASPPAHPEARSASAAESALSVGRALALGQLILLLRPRLPGGVTPGEQSLDGRSRQSFGPTPA